MAIHLTASEVLKNSFQSWIFNKKWHWIAYLRFFSDSASILGGLLKSVEFLNQWKPGPGEYHDLRHRNLSGKYFYEVTFKFIYFVNTERLQFLALMPRNLVCFSLLYSLLVLCNINCQGQSLNFVKISRIFFFLYVLLFLIIVKTGKAEVQ